MIYTYSYSFIYILYIFNIDSFLRPFMAMLNRKWMLKNLKLTDRYLKNKWIKNVYIFFYVQLLYDADSVILSNRMLPKVIKYKYFENLIRVELSNIIRWPFHISLIQYTYACFINLSTFFDYSDIAFHITFLPLEFRI